jgi:hypothetical protein
MHKKQNILYPTIIVSASQVNQLKMVKIQGKVAAALNSLSTTYGGVEV